MVAALLMLLLRDETVDFMAFQPEETTDLMLFTTPEILLLMAVQIEETLDWIAERTVEMTVLIAFHAVLIRVWMPVSSGDRNDTMAFHTALRTEGKSHVPYHLSRVIFHLPSPHSHFSPFLRRFLRKIS